MNCPICKKAGLADEALTCPQCNSDLSQFHLITSIENKLATINKIRIMTIFTLAIIVIGYSVFYFATKKLENNNKNDSSTSTHKNLVDSTAFYRHKYFLASQTIDSLKNSKPSTTIIQYKVRAGDNLSTIAYKFYSDVSKARKLAQENELKNSNLIIVNQILKIEISK